MFARMMLATLVSQIAAPEPCWSQAPDRLSAITSRIDRAAPDLMSEHKTPGVSIALIEDRTIVWRGCFGLQRAGSQLPVNEETVFEACSMSKPLYAYAVMKLVEQRKIELDRPLVDYLEQPYLPGQPLHKKITARMVLNHTTGFPNWRKGGWRAGGPLPVNFEPGSRFGYSGEGFWYLQQVTERITGEQLEPWMQRTVLQPLGMSHSSYVWQQRYDELAADGHTAKGEVKLNRRRFDRENAAYTLYTTPTDYSRFLIAMMTADGAGQQPLQRTSVATMLKPAVKTDRSNVWRGLGWAITKTDTETFVWHSGSNGTGFRCYCRFYPERGRGIVIMTNAISGEKVWRGIVAALKW